MSTYGILLPCDGTEPLPISVGDYKHLQELVGGLIDCVSTNINPADFDLEGERFTACGYVNDEGILIGLEVNAMASIVFGRELFGPVVIVSGTNPTTGDYDGENYDVPSWFLDIVFDGSLHGLANALEDHAESSAEALLYGYRDGLFTKAELVAIATLLASDDEDDQARVLLAAHIALAYKRGREDGTLVKFDRNRHLLAISEDGDIKIVDRPAITDEDIARFWEQEGGN